MWLCDSECVCVCVWTLCIRFVSYSYATGVIENFPEEKFFFYRVIYLAWRPCQPCMARTRPVVVFNVKKFTIILWWTRQYMRNRRRRKSREKIYEDNLLLMRTFSITFFRVVWFSGERRVQCLNTQTEHLQCCMLHGTTLLLPWSGPTWYVLCSWQIKVNQKSSVNYSGF